MSHLVKRSISLLISVALLVGGLAGARYFIKTKPQAQRRAISSMIPVVETAPGQATRRILEIDCLGTVIADQSASIQPEVKGRIIAVNENLVEGERVKQGDILIEIESADYELALAQAEAGLLTAQAQLRIEEGQQDVVRHELELMGNTESEDYRDLMLREPQLKSAEAAVKSAELAVESAKLDLERTRIRAPFDAVVISKSADVGDYAQNSTLVELVAIDRYFIRAAVSLGSIEALPHLGKKPYPAEITLSDGSMYKGYTHRLLPDLSEKGRMARILLAVDNPHGEPGRPLLLNEVVRVRIQGEPVEDAVLLPRKYLRDGNVVWTLDAEKKLRVLPAEILQGYADHVLLRIDGPASFEIVTTTLPAAVDGMQLRRVGEASPGQPLGGGNPAEGQQNEPRPDDTQAQNDRNKQGA